MEDPVVMQVLHATESHGNIGFDMVLTQNRHPSLVLNNSLVMR
jgi:hypothetical protein